MRNFPRFLAGLIVAIMLNPARVVSQDHSPTKDPRIVIMEETGEVQDDLPVMSLVQDGETLHDLTHHTIRNSFLDDFLDLFLLCQNYLVREGVLDKVEPAYLALTHNQGGYAKTGFILARGETFLAKPETPYVDITYESATRDVAGLMSITQLFPHEMAHVMYNLLSAEDSLASNNRSVDMHYFSIVTDYPTAFNEGFAEHMENVARHYEKNDTILAGIQEDLDRIRETSPRAISGFTRDFLLPFRMGFYKAGMINWFQKFEDYKRSEHALSGQIRYKNGYLKYGSPENRLTYRNSGVEQQEASRNIVQFHATEGAICAFFTELSLNSTAGYSRHGYGGSDPLQIQFLKYFQVIHNYVDRNYSSSSQFADFIRGYLECFPEEEAEVRKIYRELTGTEFSVDLPPALWILVTDHPHRLLTLDPFGAIEVPIYTFNLNAAEAEDLLTIKQLTAKEAEAIIQYRELNGYFERLQDLRNVPGISIEKAALFNEHQFMQPEFEQIMEEFDAELNITRLLLAPVLHILTKALLYYALILTLILILLKRDHALRLKTILRISCRYLFLWLGIVLLELIILFLFPHSGLKALIPLALIIALSMVIYRKNREKLQFTLMILGLFALISLVSIV